MMFYFFFFSLLTIFHQLGFLCWIGNCQKPRRRFLIYHILSLLTYLPKQQYLDDWRKYAKYGALYACLIYKICTTEKDEVVDLTDVSDTDTNFFEAFCYEVKNKVAFKNRARHVVNYVVENKLI